MKERLERRLSSKLGFPVAVVDSQDGISIKWSIGEGGDSMEIGVPLEEPNWLDQLAARADLLQVSPLFILETRS